MKASATLEEANAQVDDGSEPIEEREEELKDAGVSEFTLDDWNDDVYDENDVIGEPTDAKKAILEGHILDAISYLQRKWDRLRGTRDVAEVEDDNQVYHFTRYMKGGKEKIPEVRQGWREIFATTGIAHYATEDGLDCYIVMMAGGRDHVGRLANVELAIGVYDKNKKRVHDKPIILKDRYENVGGKKVVNKDGSIRQVGKKEMKRVYSAMANLLPTLKKLKLKKRPEEYVLTEV